MISRCERANLLQNFMPGNVFVFKIRRKVRHPKCARKVSGVSLGETRAWFGIELQSKTYCARFYHYPVSASDCRNEIHRFLTHARSFFLSYWKMPGFFRSADVLLRRKGVIDIKCSQKGTEAFTVIFLLVWLFSPEKPFIFTETRRMETQQRELIPFENPASANRWINCKQIKWRMILAVMIEKNSGLQRGLNPWPRDRPRDTAATRTPQAFDLCMACWGRWRKCTISQRHTLKAHFDPTLLDHNRATTKRLTSVHC